MAIVDTNLGKKNIFTAYDENSVSVDGKNYTNNVLLLHNQLIENWTNATFATLTEEDFAMLGNFDVEIILLGTGKTQQFPSAHLLQSLIAKNKAVDAMTTHAACRTYNLLVGDYRRVLAAILVK